jgi:hypothetical protein
MIRLRPPVGPVLAAAVALGSALVPGTAPAQTFPVTKGSQEIQVGFSAISLPEFVGGSISAQPELRYGRFVGEGLEVQLGAETRVWPLGTQAPKLYGGSLSVLWYPNLGPRNRNLYLLVGGGGSWNDPPQVTRDASFDPAVRAGMGVKVSLENLGLAFASGWHLTVEYREELVLYNEDEGAYAGLGTDVSTDRDLLSGLAIGVSLFR